VRFARAAKPESGPAATKPIGVVDASVATGDGATGPLSGMPAPALVVTAEGGSVPAAPVPTAPAAPPERPAVPSPWVGRAPWESTGN
jgi:hypothetical protein